MGCVVKRILQFNNAVHYGTLSIISTSGTDIAKSSLYSWSSDGVCWTTWVDYKSYLRIGKNIETDIYLRVLIYDTIKSVSLNNVVTDCYSTCIYDENPFLESLCNENTFNPYIGLDCALALQQQLADGIICMLGIPIYYFKVSPKQDTADYTFKEYIMHNIESVKQIKLMIPDGEMPSSRPQFSELDFDWETDWEVEVGKTEFARAFGDTAFPKQRDIVYIPMMQRMWEVNSAYDEKNEGLLWHSTTWKLSLIKWNEKTNVEQDNFDELIDNLVVNTYDNVFKELETNEQTRTTAVLQTERPSYTANNISNVFMQDSIRKQMTKDTIAISESQYNNKSVVVAKNIYTFTDPDSLITYQKGYCGEDGTLSFIINTKGLKTETVMPIISFGNIDIKTDGESISIGDASASLRKTDNGQTYYEYLVICRWSRKDYVQEIHAYPYVRPADIPEYMVRPELNKFDFSGTDEHGTAEYNLDYVSKKQKEVVVKGFPFDMTNIRLYNKFLPIKEAIKESVKYTTTSESCIFNDIARPLDSGNGYSPK